MIKVGNIVRIEANVVTRHRWRLGNIVEIIKGNGVLIHGVKVKIGKTRNAIIGKSRNVQLIVCIQQRYALLNTECI